ncbi:MAG: sortase [Anaerolineae bacterium]|nr:sortase [Anaerolineae bacterium]
MTIWNTIQEFVSRPRNLAIAIGVLLGICLLLFIRSRQVWSSRRAFGYDVYHADQLRLRLRRWMRIGMLGLLLVGAVYLWQLFRPKSMAEVPAQSIAEPAEALAETHIIIPHLAIDTTLIEAPFVARQWDISRLKEEVAHLEGTAYPGEPGNIVLAGHVTIPNAGWGPFKDLETLQPGAKIYLERGPETWTYEAAEVSYVEPTDVHVAFPTQDSRLTLITCAGWSEILQNYALRIVVVAFPVE